MYEKKVMEKAIALFFEVDNEGKHKYSYNDIINILKKEFAAIKDIEKLNNSTVRRWISKKDNTGNSANKTFSDTKKKSIIKALEKETAKKLDEFYNGLSQTQLSATELLNTVLKIKLDALKRFIKQHPDLDNEDIKKMFTTLDISIKDLALTQKESFESLKAFFTELREDNNTNIVIKLGKEFDNV